MAVVNPECTVLAYGPIQAVGMTHCRINETDAYLRTYTNVMVRQYEHVSRVRICPQTDRQTPGITSIIMELKVKCTCTFYFPGEFLPLLLLVRELISIKLADSENRCNKNRVKGQNLAPVTMLALG